MKRLLPITGALILGTFTLAPLTAVYAGSSDQEEIQSLEGRLVAANKAKDLTAVMALYSTSDDLLVFDSIPPRQYAGPAAWAADVKGFFASLSGPSILDISDLRITVSGDMAYSHSIQRFRGKTTQGGSVDVTMRVTDIYRHINGAWRIVHEHSSWPVNLDTGKADLQSAP